VQWVAAPQEGEDGGTGYERGILKLELTYPERRTDGQVTNPLRTRHVGLSPDSLGQEVVDLGAGRCGVVGFASLTRSKYSPRSDPAMQ
jgi:hypothetical protein